MLYLLKYDVYMSLNIVCTPICLWDKVEICFQRGGKVALPLLAFCQPLDTNVLGISQSHPDEIV